MFTRQLLLKRVSSSKRWLSNQQQQEIKRPTRPPRPPPGTVDPKAQLFLFLAGTGAAVGTISTIVLFEQMKRSPPPPPSGA